MIDIVTSFNYIVNDPFFWASMAFTTMVGIFIGAVVHNGDLDQIKKTVVSLSCYIILVISVNLSRLIPKLEDPIQKALIFQPFAPTITVLIVTVFYLFGMVIGVTLVRKAHNKK